MSEFLVGAVEAARIRSGVTETFVGVIVVAIVGNAAEHSTAVTMAMKNKMDLSLGIASRLQPADRAFCHARARVGQLGLFPITST